MERSSGELGGGWGDYGDGDDDTDEDPLLPSYEHFLRGLPQNIREDEQRSSTKASIGGGFPSYETFVLGLQGDRSFEKTARAAPAIHRPPPLPEVAAHIGDAVAARLEPPIPSSFVGTSGFSIDNHLRDNAFHFTPDPTASLCLHTCRPPFTDVL